MSASQRSSGQQFLENLAYIVPGYEGYKHRQQRKEEDSRFRVRVHRRLLQQLQMLEDIHQRWTKEAWGDHIDALSERTRQLQSIADAVRYSPYSSQEFFDTEDMASHILDNILEADLLILEAMQVSQDYIDKSSSVSTAPRTVKAFMRTLDENMDRLERLLLMREKLLASS
jgi:ATP-dependent 26S proteasome regulatory subunit